MRLVRGVSTSTEKEKGVMSAVVPSMQTGRPYLLFTSVDIGTVQVETNTQGETKDSNKHQSQSNCLEIAKP